MIRFIDGPAGAFERILPGVTAVKAGGHFPGSLVLHWDDQLFIADTMVTVPVSHLALDIMPTGLHSLAFSPHIHPIPVHDARQATRSYGPSQI